MSRKRKPRGYWKNIDNITLTLGRISSDLGRFPTHQELSRRRLGGLIDAVQDHHGGMVAVRESMGLEENQRPKDFWTLERTIELCRGLLDENNGELPTQKKLEKATGGYRGIIGGINKYGGIEWIKELLGLTSNKKPHGYWNEKTILNEARLIVNKLGYLPDNAKLKNIERGDLAHAITNYSSFDSIRKKLKCKTNRRPLGYWKDIANVHSELDIVVEKLGHFPTGSELRDLNLSSLGQGICQYHGGYMVLQKQRTGKQRRVPLGYWQNIDNVLREYRTLTQELGHFPSYEELREKKRSSLGRAIMRDHGGFTFVRQILEREGAVISEKERLEQLLGGYSENGNKKR